MEHYLIGKNNKNYCAVCQQSWKGKPKNECLGVPTEKFTVAKFEEYQRTFWQDDSLLHLNLVPTAKVCCLKKGREVFYFYNRSWGETEINDPNLPRLIERDYDFSQSYESSREFSSCLKNEVGLKKLNLVPGTAKAVAVYWDMHEKIFKEVFNPLDCQIYLDFFPSKIYSRDPHYENFKNQSIETREQLREMNLRPTADAKAVGALWSYRQDWVLYWDVESCEPIDPLLPPVYRYDNIPQDMVRESRLDRYNRIPQETDPVGAVFQENGFEMLYKPETCAILDSSLPPLVSNIINSPLKNEVELRRENLQPGNAKPVAMYYAGTRAQDYLYQAKDIFVYLFNPLDCEIYLKNPPPVAPHFWQHDEDLLTSRILRERNLKPKKGAKPSYRYWSIRNDDWNFLWNQKNCEIDNIDLPPVVEKIPKGLYPSSKLSRLNRMVTENSNATACIWAGFEFKKLYNPENCQILNPDLLPCYAQENLPSTLNSEWAWSQKEPLFKLKAGAVAKGCFKTIKSGKLVLLYDRTQLELHNREIEISQTKLKQIYRFDSNWLKKLGQPDRLQENPINPRFASMRVYSRSRVENFLTCNADEYIEYLRKKRKLPTVFHHLNSAVELNSEIKDLMQNRTMAVGQYHKCLNCAYGAITPKGFLCTINYRELKQIPCPDWQAKR